MNLNKKDRKTVLIAAAVIFAVLSAGIFSGCTDSGAPEPEPTEEPANKVYEDAVPAWAWIEIMEPNETEETKEAEEKKTKESPESIYINDPEPESENIETGKPGEPAVSEELVFKEMVFFAPKITNPALNDGSEKMAALTFDDGPSPHTGALLELLAEYESTATFFVPGSKVAGYQETIKQMAEQGCEVAGHSWGHPQLTRLTKDEIRWELQATNAAIFGITGVRPQIHRVPYGSFNDAVLEVSWELGMAAIQWNVDPRDWQVRNADAVYNNIMASIRDGSIIVLHDTHATTVEAMARVIPDLIEAGFKLVTVSELLQSIEPGIIYYGK